MNKNRLTDEGQHALNQAIDLSEKLLALAQSEQWDDFFELAEIKETHIQVLQTQMPIDAMHDHEQTAQVRSLRAQLSQLYDLNQALLNICRDQKQSYQRSLLKSKQSQKASAHYKQFSK